MRRSTRHSSWWPTAGGSPRWRTSSEVSRSAFRCSGALPARTRATEIRSQARLELVQLAEKGLIEVLVAATYPLAQAAEAHRQLATGHTHGKIILIP